GPPSKVVKPTKMENKHKCILCGTTVRVIFSTPADPSERAAFLARFNALTDNERRVMKELANNSEEAHFCVNHLPIKLNCMKATHGPTEKPQKRAGVIKMTTPAKSGNHMGQSKNHTAEPPAAVSTVNAEEPQTVERSGA
ncbi:hypothetical protein PMAYCL1PPCAC_22432, partial [Pristionchus mayeri]